MIGTSEAAVGRWERNEVEPPSRHADELASALGIDPVEAAKLKLEANALKYPAERARGNSRKYDEL